MNHFVHFESGSVKGRVKMNHVHFVQFKPPVRAVSKCRLGLGLG